MLAALLWAGLGAASATLVTLVPASPVASVGASFNVEIMADIDLADEIIGFGFDLLASSNVSFTAFTPGAGFADDPVYLAPFSDGDGIRGAAGGSLLTGGPISGLNLHLGTLHMLALSAGLASVSLTADDLAVNFTEGLIPLSIASLNFMPTVNAAQLTLQGAGGTVNEPGGLFGLALALAWLPRLRRRMQPV